MESRPDSRPQTAASHSAPLPPATLDGVYVLHQLFRIDWSSLKHVDSSDQRRMAEGLAEALGLDAEPGQTWSGAYRMVGGGVDLMLVHFRDSLEALGEAARDVGLTDAADYMLLDHDYISIVELGMYALTADVAGRVDPSDYEAYRDAIASALEGQRDKDYVRRRLNPVQPDNMPYVCYYPMDKRREGHANWYTLPLETRADLMREHGSIGRRYAGRISQVIGGSLGLSDWEWAVTLWAPDPTCFKEIVTEMRYDRTSAEYAEFGRFFVGKRASADELVALLTTEAVR